MAESRPAKKFHLGDVLSITHGALVSPAGMDGVYAILNFMTGDSLYTHQLPRAADQCKPHLLAQFPFLDDARIGAALDDLTQQIQITSVRATKEKMVADWLVAFAAGRHGVQVAVDADLMLEVKPLSSGDYQPIDPVSELIGMMGGRPDKVVVAVAPSIPKPD